jgi:HEAT repeat protein
MRNIRHTLSAAVLIAYFTIFAISVPNAVFAQAQPTAPAKPAALPPLDAVLAKLATFDGGLASDAFWQLRDHVQAAKDKPEARLACESALLAFLGSKATLPAKTLACRELRIVGGDTAVPVLGRLLLDPDLADPARYALEKIPGEAADKAVLAALPAAKKNLKLGLISTLAGRKTESAIPELAKLLRSADPAEASAAAGALGLIGGAAASDALFKVLPTAVPTLKDAFAAALLRIAGDSKAGSEIYEKILAAKVPPPIRFAATQAKLAASSNAPAAILESLSSADSDTQAAAIGLIKGRFDGAALDPILAVLFKLPEANQVKLIAVLAEYPKDIVLGTILSAANGTSKDVRITALRALEKTGDATTVPFLARAAATTFTVEQAAARTALSGLKGKDSDAAILSKLETETDTSVQAELVRALGERKIFSGKILARKLAGSPDPKVRREAVRTVRTIGTPSDIPGLLDFYLKNNDAAERQNLEAAIVGLAQKLSQVNGRAGSVLSRLPVLEKAKDIAGQASLYGLLARIGDDGALPALRASLVSKNSELQDAAARALIAWSTPAAQDDVFDLAESASSATIKVLALRGAVRITALERYRAPKAVVRDFGRALKLAERPEEKKLILGRLPDFSCPEALALAGTLLGDKDVTAEAQVALDKIKTQLVQAAKSGIL